MRENAVCAIYLMRCKQDGRPYVGSSQDVEDRWKRKKQKLRLGCHENKLVQAVWDAHGEASFSFQVLETVANPEHLNFYEQAWIDRLGAWHRHGGLNLRAKATAVRGYRYSRKPKSKFVLLIAPFRAHGCDLYNGNDLLLGRYSTRREAVLMAAYLEWFVTQPET